MRDHDHKLKRGKEKKNHYEDTWALDQDGQGAYEISVHGGF